MANIDISQIIETTAPAVPQIYAYTTPEIARHNGWTKSAIPSRMCVSA